MSVILKLAEYLMKNLDLKSIWLCKECRASFVFRSDVEEHTKRTGHNNIYQYDLSSGKLLDRIEN